MESPGAVPPYPDTDRGPLLLRTLWTLIGISTVVVAARLWGKLRNTRRLYYDDALMLLALVFGLVHAATITVAVHYGMGRHMIYLSAHAREQTLRMGVLTLAWGFLSPMAGRIAFCVTMLYLTGTDPQVKKWPIWAFIVAQLIVNIGTVIVFYSQCGTHLDVYWDPSKAAIAEKICWTAKYQTDFGYFQGSFNTLTDAFLTVLPAILIEHTTLSLKKKLGLAFLLCLSILALAASIVKTYEAKALSEVSDYTYDLCMYVIWISIELNVVIVVASIPLLRSLFRRPDKRYEQEVRPSWDNSTKGSYFSKKKKRPYATQYSMESEENIVQQDQEFEMETQTGGIVVTREVEVTYESSNAPFVHAALVGLVLGEIANPKLAKG